MNFINSQLQNVKRVQWWYDTRKEGESYLVEWNESEGEIKWTYQEFRKNSKYVVQFDTTWNHFLANGDESVIKLWDIDNTNLLTTVDGDRGLLIQL